MSYNDLPEVIAIENRCYSTPWTANSFSGNDRAILKVAVLDDRIVGYVCIRTILDETHLLNISVMPEFRRMGIASMLMFNILQALRQLNPCTKLVLEVRESNAAAAGLYKKFGFHVTGQAEGVLQKTGRGCTCNGVGYEFRHDVKRLPPLVFFFQKCYSHFSFFLLSFAVMRQEWVFPLFCFYNLNVA